MMHRRTEFTFAVAAPYDDVAPLFGAWEERRWAPGWSPTFVHPDPPRDIEGMVFLTSDPAAVWVNTRFDLAAGAMQYAYVVAGSFTTRIDIRLRRAGSAGTEVTVAYERTSLDAASDEMVASLADADAGKAEEWSREIGGSLMPAAGTKEPR